MSTSEVVYVVEMVPEQYSTLLSVQERLGRLELVLWVLVVVLCVLGVVRWRS